jgi:hypothetical protein
MQLTQFAFTLLILFLPGIICAWIVDRFTIHKPREQVWFILQSFVFGFVSYTAYAAILNLIGIVGGCIGAIQPSDLPAFKTVVFFKSLDSLEFSFSGREILWVTIISTILGFAISYAEKGKLLHRIVFKLQLTKKSGELDIWGYLFNINKDELLWLTVRDHKNDLIYDGRVIAFSDDSKDAEIILRDVSVYVNTTAEPLYQTGAVYLSRNREDISIECRALPIEDKRVSELWKEKKRRKQKNER